MGNGEKKGSRVLGFEGAEDRGRRTEDGGQMTEVGGRKSEGTDG
jgi:hypothetical protein